MSTDASGSLWHIFAHQGEHGNRCRRFKVRSVAVVPGEDSKPWLATCQQTNERCVYIYIYIYYTYTHIYIYI